MIVEQVSVYIVLYIYGFNLKMHIGVAHPFILQSYHITFDFDINFSPQHVNTINIMINIFTKRLLLSL